MKRLIAFPLFMALYTTLMAQGAYSMVEGKMVVSRFYPIDNPKSIDGIFYNSLLWFIEHKAESEEGETTPTMNVDYEKKQFAAEWILKNPNKGGQYRCTISVRVSDGILTLLFSDMTFEAETVVIKLIKRLPFERLQPSKKPQHQEHLDGFARLSEVFGKEVCAFVQENQPHIVTHQKEIESHTVVKGMTEAECLLSMGRPASVQQQDERTEWMYDAYTYLFFENGVLVSMIK